MGKRHDDMPGQESMLQPKGDEEVITEKYLDSLLEIEPSAEVATAQDATRKEEAPSEPVIDVPPKPEPVGPAVDLQERNTALLGALSAFGEISKLSGFRKAADTESWYTRSKLENRYRGATDEIAERSRQKSERLLEKGGAKRDFSKAYGYDAVRTSGLVDKSSLDLDHNSQFDLLVSKYTSSHNKQARDKYRKTLRKSSDTLAGKTPPPRKRKRIKDTEPQVRPHSNSIRKLNASGGVTEFPLIVFNEINPNEPVNFIGLAMVIGNKMAPAKADTDSDVMDTPLNVRPEHFELASPESIEKGLYTEASDSSFSHEDKPVVVVSGKEAVTDLDTLKGAVDPSVGVAFPEVEWDAIVRNPKGLVNNAMMVARDANRGKMSSHEIHDLASRAAAHALVDKLHDIDTLDRQLVQESAVLRRIYEDTQKETTERPATEVDQDRKRAEVLIHDALDVSAKIQGIKEDDLKVSHRAIASRLHRGTIEEVQSAWEDYIAMTGRYVNARRGKVAQSRVGCEKQLDKYRYYLDNTEPMPL
jgi:hypothetical protein